MTLQRAREDESQPGINISNIQVGGGIAGFIFSAGTVFIFLAGIPSLCWFIVGAAALGVVISLTLRVLHDR